MAQFIIYKSKFFIKPYAVYKRVHRQFWQQISPAYMYKKCALNWAERNNIFIDNENTTRK